jgi:hypothetical protein
VTNELKPPSAGIFQIVLGAAVQGAGATSAVFRLMFGPMICVQSAAEPMGAVAKTANVMARESFGFMIIGRGIGYALRMCPQLELAVSVQ